MSDNEYLPADNTFYEMFDKLPRKGPGSFESTVKAYEYIKNKLNKPQILDVGCGNGKQTLDLLQISDGFINAVDNYIPYIKELNEKIVSGGYSQRAVAEAGNMFKIPFKQNSFDLIWSEGAIYIMGFEKGLKEFKRFLKPGGFVAVSEISWLTETPSSEPFNFWTTNYPDIKTIDQNKAAAKSCGYKTISHFTLPEIDWWQSYYNPLIINLDNIKRKYINNVEVINVVKAEEYEIDLYKKYSNEYGYVFYILQLVNI